MEEKPDDIVGHKTFSDGEGGFRHEAGDWPDGYYMVLDGGDCYPSKGGPILYKDEERAAELAARRNLEGI